MTGRHAAPPDEAFDQRERDRAGAHRADVPVPAGPEDLQVAPAASAPVPAPVPGRKRAAPVKKPAAPEPDAKPPVSKIATPKKAGK